MVEGKVEWQHVIVCAGRQGGEWVYDSHTTACRRGRSITVPARLTAIR